VGRLAAQMTVIANDLPGFGLTSAAWSGVPSTPAGFARVLAVFLRELGHDVTHVADNSVGGWTALETVPGGEDSLAYLDALRWAYRANASAIPTYLDVMFSRPAGRVYALRFESPSAPVHLRGSRRRWFASVIEVGIFK
jgi:pimeloyl-ACP methyl ester carboxylesterase